MTRLALATRLMVLSCAAAVVAGCQSQSEQVQAARAYVGKQTVVLLSTRWCSYCTRLRQDFRQWGVPFTEYDVEHNAEGRKAYDQLDGRGIPITLVGKHRVDGYGPQQIHDLILAAHPRTDSPKKTGD